MPQVKKNSLENHWHRDSLSWLTVLLLPFSWLFRLLVAVRYYLYRSHVKKIVHFPVPVIVVGNLTVGGTGKTPFVIWLAETLQKEGYRPGIVSRGVGGKKLTQPYWVEASSNPQEVGDEAVLLAKRTGCPLVACIDRVAAVKELLQKTNCNVVISDDGLQHYRLARNIEIAIVDGARKFGNAQMLPAGPLREPIKRLRNVDLIIVNGKNKLQHETFPAKVANMNLIGETLISMVAPHEKCNLNELMSRQAHALAGIGNPERFFSVLRSHQINIIPHVFPDHYLYQRNDIYFTDELAVIMTEKDAVKCMGFADKRHWYLPVQAEVSEEVKRKIFLLLKEEIKYACIKE